MGSTGQFRTDIVRRSKRTGRRRQPPRSRGERGDSVRELARRIRWLGLGGWSSRRAQQQRSRLTPRRGRSRTASGQCAANSPAAAGGPDPAPELDLASGAEADSGATAAWATAAHRITNARGWRRPGQTSSFQRNRRGVAGQPAARRYESERRAVCRLSPACARAKSPPARDAAPRRRSARPGEQRVVRRAPRRSHRRAAGTRRAAACRRRALRRRTGSRRLNRPPVRAARSSRARRGEASDRGEERVRPRVAVTPSAAPLL